MSQLKRKDPRVTVNARVLIGRDKFLQQAYAQNISISGLFLEHLPIPVANDSLDLIIELTDIPYLGELPLTDLMKKLEQGFPKLAFPAKAQVAREVPSSESTDQMFKLGVGLRFLALGDDARLKLSNFILVMIRNIHILLRLIQQAKVQEREHILKLAKGLGYHPSLKYSELHLRVLKDYQALSW